MSKFIEDLRQLTVLVVFTKWDMYLKSVTPQRAEITQGEYCARAMGVLYGVSTSPTRCARDTNTVFFVDALNHLMLKHSGARPPLTPGVQGMTGLEGAIKSLVAGKIDSIQVKLVDIWWSSFLTSQSMVATLSSLCSNLSGSVLVAKQQLQTLNLDAQRLPLLQAEVHSAVDDYLKLLLSGYMQQLAAVLPTDQGQLRQELFEGKDKDLATCEHLKHLNELLSQERFDNHLSEQIKEKYNTILGLLPPDARMSCSILLLHAKKTFQLAAVGCCDAEIKPLTFKDIVKDIICTNGWVLNFLMLSFFPIVLSILLMHHFPRAAGVLSVLCCISALYCIAVVKHDLGDEQVEHVGHLDHQLLRNSHRCLLETATQNHILLHSNVRSKLASIAFQSSKMIIEGQQKLQSLQQQSSECTDVLVQAILNANQLPGVLSLLWRRLDLKAD